MMMVVMAAAAVAVMVVMMLVLVVIIVIIVVVMVAAAAMVVVVMIVVMMVLMLMLIVVIIFIVIVVMFVLVVIIIVVVMMMVVVLFFLVLVGVLLIGLCSMAISSALKSSLVDMAFRICSPVSSSHAVVTMVAVGFFSRSRATAAAIFSSLVVWVRLSRMQLAWLICRRRTRRSSSYTSSPCSHRPR